LAKAALSYLGEIWPASILLDELVAESAQRVQDACSAPPSPAEIQRLKDNLVQCVVGGVVQASCGPDAFVDRVSEKPVVSPLARLQAAASDIVTSRRHHAVRFDALDRILITLLDGTRDSAALVDQLVAASERGQLVVTASDQQTATPEQVRQIFAEALPVALERLKMHAMLIA
jgi:hypothetical protein